MNFSIAFLPVLLLAVAQAEVRDRIPSSPSRFLIWPHNNYLFVDYLSPFAPENSEDTKKLVLKPKWSRLIQLLKGYLHGLTPDVTEDVTVCFSKSPVKMWGTLLIDVEGLRPSITGDITGGGVHVHSGTSCTSSTTQGPHYWKPSTTGVKGDGDPWYPDSTSIAPIGAWYNTNDEGEAERVFPFDQGYGYADTVGKVIVIHDANVADAAGGYKRVACGVLMET
jgi:hypothetical protein